MKRGARVVAGEPVGQERGAGLGVQRLEVDVSEVVAGVGVARVLLQRALGQTPGLLVAVDLVVREGQRRLEPPVVAVRRGQALEKRHAVLLAVGAAGEADGAAGLVDEQRVARELRHVLGDQVEPAARLAADQRAQRVDVLALAPGGAGDRLARPPHRGPRGRRVAVGHGHQGQAGVRDRESVVRLQGRRERLLDAGSVGQQPVHAVLKAFGGTRRRGRELETVAVGDGHGPARLRQDFLNAFMAVTRAGVPPKR